MPRTLIALSLAALAAPVAVGVAATDATPKRAHYIDLTSDFSRFVDASAGVVDRDRVRVFRQQMDPLLPGFYAPRSGTTPEQYEAQVADALKRSSGPFPPRSRPASCTSASSSRDSRQPSRSIYCIRSARWTAARAISTARPT